MDTWTAVPGWVGFYEAHPDGRIRSLTRTVPAKAGGTSSRKGRVLKPVVTGAGRVQVTLTRSVNERLTAQIGQIIALTFIGPCPVGSYLLHRDDDVANNCIDNIYYGTPKQNVADAMRNGRRVHSRICPHCGLRV